MIFQKFLLLPTTTFFFCIYSLGFLPNNTKKYLYSTDLPGGIDIYLGAIAFLNSTQYEEYFEMKIFCVAGWKKKLEHSVALNIAYFSMKSHEIPKIWAKKAVIFQKFGHLNDVVVDGKELDVFLEDWRRRRRRHRFITETRWLRKWWMRRKVMLKTKPST